MRLSEHHSFVTRPTRTDKKAGFHRCRQQRGSGKDGFLLHEHVELHTELCLQHFQCFHTLFIWERECWVLCRKVLGSREMGEVVLLHLFQKQRKFQLKCFYVGIHVATSFPWPCSCRLRSFSISVTSVKNARCHFHSGSISSGTVLPFE